MKSQAKPGVCNAFVPLLPEIEPPDSPPPVGASFSSAVFNISTSIIGAGIMSIPATLRVLGIGPAFFLLAVVPFLCDASVEFLMRYTAAGDSPADASYSGVMAESFGRMGSLGLLICVALTNMGALIMYLIIIGDVLSGNRSEGTVHLGVLQEWFGEEWWTGRAAAIAVTVFVVMLPLVLLRRVDSLRFTSAVSILLAVVFVFISLGMAIYALFHGTIQTPKLLPDFTHHSFLELFTAVPVIVVAFTFHFNVHPIRAEMRRVSDMTPAVRASLLLCSVIYATVGLAGYLLFGEETMSDVLSNFDRSLTSPLLDVVVRLSYALHLVLVFPLIFYSLRLNIDELLFPKARLLLVADTSRFLCLTALLLVFIYLAAMVIPNIWVVFQFAGSTTAVCLSLIFPGAIVLRDVHGICKRKDKLLAGTMIAIAVITSCIAIYSDFSNLFDGRMKSSNSQ
ncbi:probable sodium-coupled neutral amino acid transporter 6 [Phalaenopsis equestris]|uniref:probable sodium-coupled neutral amino acid transporter 6 n=1 Tax=Phalaenopsis equestris TaxID=78828 RepID=UPI0009E3366B|nr:probable sodium-coupled neutral amino acid transporter 6 [Phalaenopsis equestris]